VDGLVPLTVMVGTILFCSEKYKIVLDWSRVPDLWLVLDGIEDLIDGEPKRSEVLCQFERLVQTRERTRSAHILQAGCPRFGFLAPVVALYCGFDFSPSLPRLADRLVELFISFFNWM